MTLSIASVAAQGVISRDVTPTSHLPTTATNVTLHLTKNIFWLSDHEFGKVKKRPPDLSRDTQELTPTILEDLGGSQGSGLQDLGQVNRGS